MDDYVRGPDVRNENSAIVRPGLPHMTFAFRISHSALAVCLVEIVHLDLLLVEPPLSQKCSSLRAMLVDDVQHFQGVN